MGKPNTTSNRCRLRISLRSALILLTAICTWLAWHSVRAREQRVAVQWVKENHGFVVYNFQSTESGHIDTNSRPPGPGWLRESIGIDYLATVVAVQIFDSPKSDLTLLSSFKRLKFLNLVGMGLNDLTSVPRIRTLEWLAVTDGELVTLDGIDRFPNLEFLYINAPELADIVSVGTLSKLDMLSLLHAPVKNAAPIFRLRQLESLVLLETDISDFERLKIMPTLKLLQVDHQNIIPYSPSGN